MELKSIKPILSNFPIFFPPFKTIFFVFLSFFSYYYGVLKRFLDYKIAQVNRAFLRLLEYDIFEKLDMQRAILGCNPWGKRLEII